MNCPFTVSNNTNFCFTNNMKYIAKWIAKDTTISCSKFHLNNFTLNWEILDMDLHVD